jgi:hypothetical protein
MKIRKNSLVAVPLFLGITLFPLYIGASGSMQISHAALLMAFLVSLSLFKGLKIKDFRAPIFTLLAFLFCVTLRQNIYYAEYQIDDMRTLMPIMYLSFNLAIYVMVINYLNNGGSISTVKKSLILSLIIALVGIYLYGFSLTMNEDRIERSVGTFNNPNQLGYYSVCVLSMLLLLSVFRKLSNPFLYLLVAATVLLSVVSLSKAAMIAVLMSIVIYHMGNYKAVVVALLLLLSAFLAMDLDSLENYQAFNRLISIGSDNDDNLISRGYGVLFNLDHRIIYGWGEGYTLAGHPGFTPEHGLEVHSTLGSVLIGYGLIGFSVISIFLFRLFYRLISKVGFVYSSSIFVGPFLYGLTHNGIRFTIFWVFLAMATYYAYSKAGAVKPISNSADAGI